MIPLEDNFSDVISKAQRGLEISDSDLAEKARLDANAIRKLRGGHFDELAVFRVAPVLGLGARALSDLAQNEYRPTARTSGSTVRSAATTIPTPISKSRAASAAYSSQPCTPTPGSTAAARARRSFTASQSGLSGGASTRMRFAPLASSFAT